MEKFNVLGVSRSEIGKLQQCLIEFEVSKIHLPCLPHFVEELKQICFCYNELDFMNNKINNLTFMDNIRFNLIESFSPVFYLSNS